MEREIDSELVNFLVGLVKEKKELRNVDYGIVKEKILKILNSNNKILQNLSANKKNKKNRYVKEFVKEIRAELREIYGVFILKNYSKKENLLEKIGKDPKIENYNKILRLHKSSKERLPYYAAVYKMIFTITGRPKNIVDLACGLNPVSYPYLGFNPEYFASDLNQKDCDFINKFFEKLSIPGKAVPIDLTKPEEWSKIPECDVCFLLKTLDSLETVKKNVSRELINAINCKFLVVSFPKESLGGKKSIDSSKRNWFYKILQQKKFKYEEFEVSNELFIVVSIYK